MLFLRARSRAKSSFTVGLGLVGVTGAGTPAENRRSNTLAGSSSGKIAWPGPLWNSE